MKRHARILLWFWPAAVAAVIFAASSRSALASPGDLVPSVDKVAHFGVYGLLATLLCRVRPEGRGAFWAWFAASAYGVTDELHQSFVPGREPSGADLIADTTGAALAVTLYCGVGWYRRLLETPLWGRREVTETERIAEASAAERAGA